MTSIWVLLNALNVIIKIAVCKLIDIVFDPYASAVGEKHTTAARHGRLAFLKCKGATLTKAERKRNNPFCICIGTKVRTSNSNRYLA